MKWDRERYRLYLDSGEWARQRAEALERAEHRCQVCNGGKDLHVHHRTYARVGDEAAADLTVLCARCHELFHRRSKPRRRRGNRGNLPRAVRVSWMQDIHGDLEAELDTRLERD